MPASSARRSRVQRRQGLRPFVVSSAIRWHASVVHVANLVTPASTASTGGAGTRLAMAEDVRLWQSRTAFRETCSVVVGRMREQVFLREELAATFSSHGRLVLLGGEAGIGKTTLSRDLAREAATRGAWCADRPLLRPDEHAAVRSLARPRGYLPARLRTPEPSVRFHWRHSGAGYRPGCALCRCSPLLLRAQR